jgi:hypothetical protein
MDFILPCAVKSSFADLSLSLEINHCRMPYFFDKKTGFLLLLLFNHLPPDITGGQGLKKTILEIFFTVHKTQYAMMKKDKSTY